MEIKYPRYIPYQQPYKPCINGISKNQQIPVNEKTDDAAKTIEYEPVQQSEKTVISERRKIEIIKHVGFDEPHTSTKIIVKKVSENEDDNENSKENSEGSVGSYGNSYHNNNFLVICSTFVYVVLSIN